MYIWFYSCSLIICLFTVESHFYIDVAFRILFGKANSFLLIFQKFIGYYKVYFSKPVNIY